MGNYFCRTSQNHVSYDEDSYSNETYSNETYSNETYSNETYSNEPIRRTSSDTECLTEQIQILFMAHY
jgi:spore germination cell wall hydrolase CwlJ-like protein